jgi:ATP-dependent 26S proteasome regulatory subunit
MTERITNYLRAGYSGLYVVSHEEARAEAAVADSIERLNAKLPKNDPKVPTFKLYAWSLTQGTVDARTGDAIGKDHGVEDVLVWFQEQPERSVLLLRDYHLFVEDKNPVVWRRLHDVLRSGKAANKAVVILACRLAIPPELEKEITVLDFSLPTREQLRDTLAELVEGNKIKPENVEDAGLLAAAAAGLTAAEAEQAFALSLVETGRITREIVFREKCQAVRKNGMLEIVEGKVTLDDIGGLENLKKWLLERRDAFSDEARAYNLPVPRGCLAVGQPGTGKSLTAKATASVFGVPLLRLDAAKLFGSLVGQSEANWRAVHATAKAMAPCILWIDEVDGAMSGSGSSGQTDGGTTARVVKSILQDMQDNSEGIFYMLTANDVDALPSPLLRRMDEVWNVELPTAAERELIWGIQLKRVKRDPATFDLTKLAMDSVDYSGAEIEKAVAQALYRAFPERREPTMEDFAAITKEFMPLAKTMSADIDRRRKRLEGVAKLAGGTVKVVQAKPARKILSVGGKAA